MRGNLGGEFRPKDTIFLWNFHPGWGANHVACINHRSEKGAPIVSEIYLKGLGKGVFRTRTTDRQRLPRLTAKFRSHVYIFQVPIANLGAFGEIEGMHTRAATLLKHDIVAPVHETIVLEESACLDLLPFRPGIIDDVGWSEMKSYHDERGWLCEFYRQDETRADLQPAMAYLSETLPGATRGPHEHLQQTDSFRFLGPAPFHLYLWDNRPESPTYLCHQIVVIRKPTAVVIPPGIVHAYRNVGAVAGLIINCPNRLYRGEGKRDPVDEIRHEDDPNTVFQLLAWVRLFLCAGSPWLHRGAGSSRRTRFPLPAEFRASMATSRPPCFRTSGTRLHRPGSRAS
jgi:dTDP-4-dehydrorhamnose 3,5-epimerase